MTYIFNATQVSELATLRNAGQFADAYQYYGDRISNP